MNELQLKQSENATIHPQIDKLTQDPIDLLMNALSLEERFKQVYVPLFLVEHVDVLYHEIEQDLIKSGLYRFKVKRNVKDVRKRLGDVDQRVRNSFDVMKVNAYESFLNKCDQFTDEIKEHQNKLVYAYSLYLTKNHPEIEHHMVIAKLLTALALSYLVIVFDEQFGQLVRERTGMSDYQVRKSPVANNTMNLTAEVIGLLFKDWKSIDNEEFNIKNGMKSIGNLVFNTQFDLGNVTSNQD